jgi:hypothetical protein
MTKRGAAVRGSKDQSGFAEASRGRDEGHAWRAARRRGLVQPLDQASTEWSTAFGGGVRRIEFRGKN